MKNKILLFSFLLLSLTASAQYFEVGMKWVYGQYTTQPGWPPSIGTITITGDTTINGEAAFIIDPPGWAIGNPDIRYIGESGQQVYYYVNDEKRLLYDFSLLVGDTLTVKAQWCCNGDVLDTIIGVVDTVKSITVSGESLKYQKFASGLDWAWEHVEGVGSLYSFFPNYGLADNPYSKLRCVIYPNGDILKFTDDEDCYTIMGVNDIQQSGLAMYPNPVMDELTIENKEGKAYELRIFNQQGQLIFTAPSSYENKKIATTTWASGTYLVQVVSNEGVFMDVLVKQ